MAVLVRLRALPSAIVAEGPRGRLFRGVLANIYDKGAVTFVQLLTIPVLTYVWGADGYGIWLMLLTIPTYIALSDLGLGAAAGVAITKHVAMGETDEALAVFQSTAAFVMVTIAVASLAALLYAGWYWIEGAQIGPFSAEEIAVAIVLITFYSIIVAQMSIVTIVYRGTHRFAFAMMQAGTLIFIEGVALLTCAWFGLGLVASALAYLVIRLVGYLFFARALRRREPWVAFGFSHARWSIVRVLALPSVAALALTFATAVLLQGIVLVLGATAGPAAVATFGAARTLSRAPLQLSGLVIRPSLPELTRAIVEGNRKLETNLDRINIGVALAATVPIGLVLIAFGQPLIGWMSHGELSAATSLMIVLCAAATLNAVWTALAAPLVAMNRQDEFSFLYLSLAGIALTAVYFLPHDGILLAATATLVVEAIIFARVFHIRHHKAGARRPQ